MTLFFCLSGFVLTWTYVGRPTGRAYAVARFARIYPVFALFLVLDALLIANPNHSAGEFARHALLVQAWEPEDARAAYLSPSWSLSVELVFYALFPLLIVGLRRLDRRTLGALAIGSALLPFAFAASAASTGAATGPTMDWLYYSPLLRLPDFVLGCTLALLLPRVRLPLALAIVCAAIGVDLAIGGSPDYSVWGLDALYLAPVGLLIVAVSQSNVLTSSTAQLLGGASYALYLSHALVIYLVRKSAPDALLSGPLEWLAIFGLSIGVSVLVFVFFEEPLRRAIRRPRLHGATLPDVAAAPSRP